MIGWVTKRAVFEHLHKRIIQTANNNCGYVADAGVIISDLADRLQVWLNEMDTVDAVPVVHGKWVKSGRWGRVYRCDQCGNYLDFDGVNVGRGDANYCPNCGSRNRSEE